MRVTGSIIIIFIFLGGIGAGYFIFSEKKSEKDLKGSITQSAQIEEKEGYKTFIFDNFHGSSEISPKFQFQYPAKWYNDGQYFSPAKIEFYNLFTAKAPIYFDLVLAEILHLTELQYKIDNSKRRTPDSIGEIAGYEFKKYDLIDYGSYGGDSAGRLKIFVGPKIKIDGADYILVFHWEEKPLAEYVPENNIEVFDNILLSLKFYPVK